MEILGGGNLGNSHVHDSLLKTLANIISSECISPNNVHCINIPFFKNSFTQQVPAFNDGMSTLWGGTMLALGTQRSPVQSCIFKELANLPKENRREKCN